MLTPPVPPMLARLARELPTGGSWIYEPKWDGFRVLVFRAADGVVLQSRNLRPLGRYFPEVANDLHALPAGTVVDAELVLDEPTLGFAALLERIHPAASRVERLAAERPVHVVTFDLLCAGGADLTATPLSGRREALERLAGTTSDGRVRVGPATRDVTVARQWLDQESPAWDGVMAKGIDTAYRPGARDWVKVKVDRTADCVVAGARFDSGGRPTSMLLGLWMPDGRLHHPGTVGSLSAAVRTDVARLALRAAVPLEQHPWREGFGVEGGATGRLRGAGGRWLPGMTQDWTPLAPTDVVEVGYDRVDGLRLRHPARFRRWRPDRDPASCTVDQLVEVGQTAS